MRSRGRGFIKMLVYVLVLIFSLQSCSAYIFYLNETEYVRMPPIYHLDPYESCLHAHQDSGVYCSVKFSLVADEPSELYTMIRNYSARTETHFNHTILSYGICLTDTCKKFYKRNNIEDQGATLEACLNDTLWEKYKLKARISDEYKCEKVDDKIKTDPADIAVAVLIGTLLMFNLIGSLREFKRDEDHENGVFDCFSIRRNWKKLVAQGAEGPEPRLTRLKGFYGIKTINVILVIMTHSMLTFTVDSDNIHFYEESYRELVNQLLVNGTVMIQTFFVMSGFLLAYNLSLLAEKHKFNFLTLLEGVTNRYLRLTPAYIVVLAITATWLKHFGAGPLWQSVVVNEVDQCRQNWWYNILYMNNYIDKESCMVHTWYIAADFQLYLVGLLVMVLTRGPFRKILLASLFLVGVAASVAHTYLRDLDGILIITPEMFRDFFGKDETLNHTYKRGHTNLPAYVIGLALGQFVYEWQTTDYKFPKFVRHRFTVWMTGPAMLGTIMLGAVFYRDAPRASIYIRALYAAFMKPLFGGLFGFILVAMVFKFENIFRGVLEWPGWVVPARLSYCSYLVHFLLLRVLTGTRTTLVHNTVLHYCELFTSSIALSFLAALPINLLVEAPFHQLVKVIMSKRKQNPILNIDDKRANREFGELKTVQMAYNVKSLGVPKIKTGKHNESFVEDETLEVKSDHGEQKGILVKNDIKINGAVNWDNETNIANNGVEKPNAVTNIE